MSRLNPKTLGTEAVEEEIQCPYCLKIVSVEPAPDYAPIYSHCPACGRRFILERVIEGVQALRLEDAPASSDPDRREIEMGMGQEE